MRALLPLLAALAAASPAPSAPPPPAARRTPLVLVLRAACDAPLRAAFDEAQLLRYEPARSLLERYRVRLLSYEGEEVRQSHTSTSPDLSSH